MLHLSPSNAAEFFLKVQCFICLHPTQHRHMDKISLRRKFIAGSGLIKAAQSSEIMKGTASFRLSSWQIWQDNMPFDPRIFSIAVNEMIPKEVWSLIWPEEYKGVTIYIHTYDRWDFSQDTYVSNNIQLMYWSYTHPGIHRCRYTCVLIKESHVEKKP